MNTKKITLIGIIAIVFQLSYGQEIIKKDDALNLSLQKRVVTQKQIYTDGQEIIHSFGLIELIKKEEGKDKLICYHLVVSLAGDIVNTGGIGDFTYNKKDDKIYVVASSKYSPSFIVYKVDMHTSLPNVGEGSYESKEILSKEKTDSIRISHEYHMYRYKHEKQVFSPYDNSLILGEKLFGVHFYAQEINIEIIDDEIHVIVNETTDKKVFVYNEDDGWKHLEE